MKSVWIVGGVSVGILLFCGGVSRLVEAALEYWEAKKHARALARRPVRMYLVRHGESQGQIDAATYSRISDNEVPITDQGRKQAQEAGRKLREMIGDDPVKFWFSPYKRCRMTLEHILEAFEGQRYFLSEEPRLREQDYGNYQNVDAIKDCIRQRRKFGLFYYRFPEGESGADVYDRVSTYLSLSLRFLF
jgi:broad specificity phosphatase PhoE